MSGVRRALGLSDQPGARTGLRIQAGNTLHVLGENWKFFRADHRVYIPIGGARARSY